MSEILDEDFLGKEDKRQDELKEEERKFMLCAFLLFVVALILSFFEKQLVTMTLIVPLVAFISAIIINVFPFQTYTYRERFIRTVFILMNVYYVAIIIIILLLLY